MGDVDTVAPSPKIARARDQSPQPTVDYQVNSLLSLPPLALQPASGDVFGSSLLSLAAQDDVGDVLRPTRNATNTLLALSSIKRKFKSRAIAPATGGALNDSNGRLKCEGDAVGNRKVTTPCRVYLYFVYVRIVVW